MTPAGARAAPETGHSPFDAASFDRAMAPLGPFEPAPALAVAVSGGADSMALLLCADGWARTHGGTLTALTVDHGLRAGSDAEAAQVAAWCAARGIAHEILVWEGDKPATGVQAAARAARYDLLTGWCRSHAVAHLLVAHHAADQAETFLYRMGRGSGVDGLACMPSVAVRDGVRLLRPLLGVDPARLTALLDAAGQPWIDDPSNHDRRYARIAIRARLPELAAAGIGLEAMGRAIQALGTLRAAVETERAALAAAAVALFPEGYAEIDLEALRAAAPETARAVLAATLQGVGGGAFPPRRARLDRLADAVLGPGRPRARTLGGCVVAPAGGLLRIWREARAAEEAAVPAGRSRLRWDGRFDIVLDARRAAGLTVARLGEDGWQAVADRLNKADFEEIPGPVRFSLPALRDGGEIAEIPHLRYRRARSGAPIVTSALFRPNSALFGAPFRVA